MLLWENFAKGFLRMQGGCPSNIVEEKFHRRTVSRGRCLCIFETNRHGGRQRDKPRYREKPCLCMEGEKPKGMKLTLVRQIQDISKLSP